MANKLEFRASTAVGEVITGLNLTSFNVYQIHETDELSYPAAIVHCEGGKEYLRNTGIFEIVVKVGVYSMGDETNAETVHHNRVASIRDALTDDGIATTLSGNESEFTAINVEWDEIDNGVDKNRSLVSTITLKIIGCASDV